MVIQHFPVKLDDKNYSIWRAQFLSIFCAHGLIDYVYLDENKQLILAILDNQNLGKLAECAQYQTQLQKNLLYLAAIADAQSPAPTAHPQQGSPFGQQQQQQQTPLYHSRAAQPFNLQQIQHHQTMFPGHAGTKPIGNTSELLPGNALQATRRMHGEAAECGGLPERT